MIKPRIKGSVACSAVLVAAIIGLTTCLPKSSGFASCLHSSQKQLRKQQQLSGSITLQAAARRTISPQLSFRYQKRRLSTSCTTTTTTTALLASASPVLSVSPLIASGDCWGNWAVLTGTAAAAQILGTTTAVGRLLGPPVTAMALTFVLASIGILTPGGTVAAKQLQLLSLQLATPLILLGADLRDASKRCGPLLISFAAASMATLVASLVGWYGTVRSCTIVSWCCFYTCVPQHFQTVSYHIFRDPCCWQH